MKSSWGGGIMPLESEYRKQIFQKKSDCCKALQCTTVRMSFSSL